jgi:two-component system LytT family response regulator
MPSDSTHARSRIRVLIVDDEPVARQTVRLLLQHDPDISVAAECANGQAALEVMRREPVDLVFLDVQMPGMDGFEMLHALEAKRFPAIIFTTAYDQYALKAFDVHALDYLLKPFDDDRFHEALTRAKGIILGNKMEEISKQLFDLLERYQLKDRPSTRLETRQEHQYLTRFMIRSTGRVVVVDVDTVEWIEADGNYVNIFAEGKKHLLREKMSVLEEQLDPSRFARIHRSTIIRADRIKTLKPLFNGDYTVTMSDGKEFTLSRTYRERVLSALA